MDIEQKVSVIDFEDRKFGKWREVRGCRCYQFIKILGDSDYIRNRKKEFLGY